MKSNSTLLNAILEEMAHPRTNYDILNDIDIPEFEIQQIGVEPMPTASTMAEPTPQAAPTPTPLLALMRADG